jgi:hypothetical protein
VNAAHGSTVGLVTSALVAVTFIVARWKTWPRESDPALIPLDAAAAGATERARAKLLEVGEWVVLREGSTLVRARASSEVHARCAALGRGARVIVRIARVPEEVAGATYRDEAAALVPELTSIARDLRPTFTRALFGGDVGVNLVLALAGLAAAIVAYFVWR